jgi:NADPH:quinone reductase-like Zn-dependent oxidoreductase
MKAIVYAEYGGPEVLRLEDVAEPHAGPGQVRLKVVAAGVNPVDYKIRRGWMPHMAPASLPAIPAWKRPAWSMRSGRASPVSRWVTR